MSKKTVVLIAAGVLLAAGSAAAILPQLAGDADTPLRGGFDGQTFGDAGPPPTVPSRSVLQ